MASYALPLNSGSTAHSHGHSPSHSRPVISERPPSWIGQLNGGALKKMPSNTSLHSHSHSHSHLDHQLSHDMGPSDHQHSHSHSTPVDKVLALNPFTKGRPRGESDLGRAPPRISNTSKGYAFDTIEEAPVPTGTLWPTPEELLTALLIPLPYLFASIAYPAAVAVPPTPFPAPKNFPGEPELADTTSLGAKLGSNLSPFVLACTLSSTTLILVGIVSKLRSLGEPLDRRKGSLGGSNDSGKKQDYFWSTAGLRRLGGRIFSVLLPFYGAMHLGGARAAIVLLTVAATGIGSFDTRPVKHSFLDSWKRTFRTRKATCGVLLLGLLADFLDASASSSTLILGHLALVLSILTIPPPFPTTGWSLLTKFKGAPTSSTSGAGAPSIPRLSLAKPVSPLVSSPEDTHLTLLAGLILSGITMISAIALSAAPSISFPAITFSTLSVASATGLVFFSVPSSLRTQRKPGVALGCILIAAFGYLQSSGIWRRSPYIAAFCTLCYAAVTFDTTASVIPHDAGHHDHDHKHQHNHPLHGNHSRITGILLRKCTPGSILRSILMERDSRRIAYFAVLNLGFMLVQFFYGFVSGSLGLLTDSIHMLFDCAGLAVGLAAAVMSKWRPSVRFPYGFGKIDTISGFANGIFLMLVSVEIVFDAFERLWEGSELHRLDELLVVSVLGFLVNLVGLTAFGHAHHGHDHGGHDHGGHGHSHDNENMQGIFLHIMADALGSVAVIISTLLTKYYGWSGWDPIASCAIAVLIFLSAMPLVKSSGLRLLLSLSADVEYGIRNTLQELSSLRGVVGYTVPRFWLEDAGAAHAEAHAHDHKHDHDHDHSHDHSHEEPAPTHTHGDDCDHGHSHESPHEHDHGHDHSHDDHAHAHPPAQPKILGVIHIITSRIADPEDVRERTVQFLKGRGMDVVVHVEREGDGRCWCGGGSKVG
ncbi:cation efflux protein [Mytilinidion resinicola]|uniref:Zinc transporter n=1 Tax=Mytilinidion resinicola TaxID=574789 RepID=A0A6A6YGQ2_9PEZI|nr:cation efflux protein [Mytilinidion resinicola]KAF2807713.1 cation efflux protein [Mytilinidion resinicola]